jgi:hypothetical protein
VTIAGKVSKRRAFRQAAEAMGRVFVGAKIGRQMVVKIPKFADANKNADSKTL